MSVLLRTISCFEVVDLWRVACCVIAGRRWELLLRSSTVASTELLVAVHTGGED